MAEILRLTARNLLAPGWDESTGHGLLQLGDALAHVDSLSLVHDSTTTIDSWYSDSTVVSIEFKNIFYTTGPTVQFIGNAGESYLTRQHEFTTTVSLSENTNTAHVPNVWPRGRQCLSAREATTEYDGALEQYHAVVSSSNATSATLVGITYELFEDVSEPCDSLLGWYPIIRPPSGSSTTVFSYSYLADTTSSAARQNPIASFGIRANRAFAVEGGAAAIQFVSPSAGPGTIEVFDIAGRRVFQTAELEVVAGVNEFNWDLRDKRGRVLPAGIYFGRLKIGGESAKFRIVNVR